MNLPKFLTNLLPKKKPEEKEVEVSEVMVKPRPPGWHKAKMTEEQQHTLIDLMAQGLTHFQINEKMMDYCGIKITSQLVYQYENTHKWKPMLRELRTKYQNDLTVLDATHKHARVRRMDHVMDKAIKKGDLRVAVAANEQIRKEFEKDGGDVNIYNNTATYQQLNVLSTEELVRRYELATKKLKEKTNDGPNRIAEENKIE